MYRLILPICIAVLALPALASDISGLKTKVLRGLEGPAQGRHISNGVIGATSLSAEGLDGLAGRDLRARYWSILPGGIVPVHEHAERPATIFTLQGEILEYRNDREEPVEHEAGGLSLEEGAQLSHWWMNKGDEIVRLIAFDVVITDRDQVGGPADDVPDMLDIDLPDGQGVEWTLEGNVDLEAHFLGEFGKGLSLSHYRIEIAPGGVAPLDTAPGEPAIVFVEAGEVTQHGGDAPMVLARESGAVVARGAVAWWVNSGSSPAELHVGIVEPLAKASAEHHAE